MKKFTVQVSITDAVVTFIVPAQTLEEAIVIGRSTLRTRNFWAKDIDLIDQGAEITGVY